MQKFKSGALIVPIAATDPRPPMMVLPLGETSATACKLMFYIGHIADWPSRLTEIAD